MNYKVLAVCGVIALAAVGLSMCTEDKHVETKGASLDEPNEYVDPDTGEALSPKEYRERRYLRQQVQFQEAIEKEEERQQALLEEEKSLNGVIQTHHDNGQVRMEEHYKDGQLHGFSKTWHPNGKLALQVSYSEGHQTGEATEWSEEGVVIRRWNEETDSESVFSEEGVPVYIRKFDKHGSGYERHWYPNGQRKSEMIFKFNQPIGEESLWNEVGIKIKDGLDIEE